MCKSCVPFTKYKHNNSDTLESGFIVLSSDQLKVKVSPMLPSKLFQCWSEWQNHISFQGELATAAFFYASLLQMINGVMSLAPHTYLQIEFQAPKHSRSSRTQARVCNVPLPADPRIQSFPLTPQCPGVHRNLWSSQMPIHLSEGGWGGGVSSWICILLWSGCQFLGNPAIFIFKQTQAVGSLWMVAIPCFIVELHPERPQNRAVCLQCEILLLAVFFWVRNMIS